MSTVDNIRNNIIDKLLTISNKDYLSALFRIIETSNTSDDTIALTKEQRKMLELSEKDIDNGNLISHEQLNKEDKEWLKGL